MRLKLLLFLASAALSLLVINTIQAQLVNHDRRVKRQAAKSDEPPAVPLPFWKQTLPAVTGKREVYYDINRDGILQTSETKIYLRDIVPVIKEKGGVQVFDSGILKAYDKNKDGVVNKYELQAIEKDLKDDQ